MNAPYNATLMRDLTTMQQDSKGNSSQLEYLDYKNEKFTSHRDKRDINAKVVSRNDYKDSTDSQTEKDFYENELEELDFLEIPDIIKNDHEQADVLVTDRGKDPNPNTIAPTKNNLGETNIHSVENEEQFSSQKSLGKNEITFQPTVSSLPTKARSDLRQLTPHNSVPLTSPSPQSPPSQAQVINSSSFLSSFTGTLAAVFLLGLIALIVYIVYKKCVHRMMGYKKLSGVSKPKELQRQGSSK